MKELKTDCWVPLYQQLHDAIREDVQAGRYAAGEQIPSEDKLSEMYAVSRVTVRTAMQLLAKENVLVKRHGKGTFVAIPAFVESMSAGGSFTRSCLQLGAVPSTRLISSDTRPAEQGVADRLPVAVGSSVICIKRVRLVDGVATILEVDYFQPDFAFLLSADLEHTPLSELLLEGCGQTSNQFEDQFEVAFATKEQAGQLHITAGTPLLRVFQTVKGTNGQVLYCNEQYIITDRYKYAVCYY